MDVTEYLEHNGWALKDDAWVHPRHTDRDGGPRRHALWEAEKAQLAADRAALAFVFSHSVFRATFPDGAGLTVDFTGATIETAAKERTAP